MGQTLYSYSPEEIAEAVKACGSDVFRFTEQSDIFPILLENFSNDMASAGCQEPYSISDNGVIYKFPNEVWTHRIMGSFSNHLVSTNKDLACAISVLNSDGTYRISVRSSINDPHGAGDLCKKFAVPLHIRDRRAGDREHLRAHIQTQVHHGGRAIGLMSGSAS